MQGVRSALALVCAYLATGIYADDAPISDATEDLVRERWSSIEGCERAGELERAPGIARIATWNVRWFPDGTYHDDPESDYATDGEWLACEMARLNADVFAIQEFKKHPRAAERADQLIERLDRATGGAWQIVLDDCPHENLPHVGFLYDSSRVRGSDFRAIAALNPHNGPCDQAAHPGFAGRFELSGGLDVELVSVHAQWGLGAEDLELRRRTYHALGEVYRDILEDTGDRDVIFLGDFNTNGCTDCGEALTGVEEIAELNRIARAIDHPFHVLGADAACTEYENGVAWMLDHAVVPTGMAEAEGATATVHGYCGAVECRAGDDLPAAFQSLSDHCPVVVDLLDRDIDRAETAGARLARRVDSLDSK